jgi:hypothetical protein
MERMPGAAVTDDEHIVTDRQRLRALARHGRRIERSERQYQTEAAGLIVPERVRLADPATMAGEPNRFSLGDQITDGQDQITLAGADDDALADAIGAEKRSRIGIIGNFSVQEYD